MTDNRYAHLRAAVLEIVDHAPLAPSVGEIEAVPRDSGGPGGRRRFAMAAAGLLLAIAAVAVVATRSDGPQRVPSTAPSTTLPPEATISADDAFRLMRVSSAALANMDAMAGPLIEACMLAKGYVFVPTSAAPAVVQGEALFLQQRYQSPHQEAGVWGYVFESLVGEDSNQPMEEDSPDADKPGFAEALLGDPVLTSRVNYPDGSIAVANSVSDGCAGQAMSSIFGSPAAYLNFMNRVNRIEVAANRSWTELRSDSEYVQHLAGWVSCMNAEGLDFPSPSSAWDTQWPSPRPSAAETKAAEADASCRASNQLENEDLLALETAELERLLTTSPIAVDTEFDATLQALLEGM